MLCFALVFMAFLRIIPKTTNPELLSQPVVKSVLHSAGRMYAEGGRFSVRLA